MMTDDTPATPASRLISRFGVKSLAYWSGRHVSRVYAWAKPANQGGTGGFIPVRARRLIVEGALRDNGEAVAWTDFEPQAGEMYAVPGLEAA